MTTTTLSDLWKTFKLLSDPQTLTEEQRIFFQSFLTEESQLRE